MTGTGAQTQTWATGVTTIALLVLRTGELKINERGTFPTRLHASSKDSDQPVHPHMVISHRCLPEDALDP